LKILKNLPILTIGQQIVKHTPLYKTELVIMLKVLVKLGIQYKVAMLVLAFLL
jgi:hypothetical protein